MLPHLAATARSAREAAELRQIDIATAAGVAHTSVSRFELGQSWPQDPDRMLGAYAEETGIDELTLWQRALQRWSSL